MTLKIDNTARLPFEMTKGDYQSRCSKIDAANTRLFEKIIENKDDLNLQKLEDLMSDAGRWKVWKMGVENLAI